MEANIINDNFVHDSNYKRIYIKQNMDYEEKYKKTLEKARKELQACGSLDCDAARQIFRFFPELKESEDEKIRKALIDIVNARCELYKGITKEMFLAWLEKQGEQKEDATRYKITEHLKKLILDQSQRGAHMLDYEGRIEEEVDFVISIAKKELKNEKQSEWSKEDLPEFESYLCLMFQKFRTKGVCTNGEIVDFVKEHSQKLKDTLCHPWSKEDKKMLAEIVKDLQVCKSKDISRASKDAYQNEIDWLNAHYFDYRGLIEKGLAIEAPEGMYKFD